MMEGIKSWLTLSKTEKQEFIEKYKEFQINHRKKLADYLKNVKPYMKKKNNVMKSDEDCKIKNNVTEALKDDINTVIDNSEINLSDPVEPTKDCPNSNVHNIENENSVYDDEKSCTDEQTQEAIYSHGNEEYSMNKDLVSDPLLSEPTPPSIRTARELFDMLNTSNGSNIETWNSLTNAQKTRYRSVVQLLKQDYITKYMAYLESLPSKDLFNYYNNFFD